MFAVLTSGHVLECFDIFSGKTQHHNGYDGCRTTSLPPTLFSSRPAVLLAKNSSRPTLEAPLRPCIIIRDLPYASSSQSEPSSPTRLKKRVVFADDKGFDLAEVRVMKEPSSCPPRWSPDFLDLVLRGTGAESPEQQGWEATFPQPAANYKEFREKLERDNVALENVIIKAESEEVTGTVKVRNLGFHKEVLVRSVHAHHFLNDPCNLVRPVVHILPLRNTVSKNLSTPKLTTCNGRVSPLPLWLFF